MTSGSILTIGHSTHDLADLIELLRRHDVTALADVRSVPASRFAPQFNRGSVRSGLRDTGIGYVFLGKELGARTDDTSCYVDGQVRYRRLARTPEFRGGIGRLMNGARTERIALLCAEAEPLDCHRTVLVARALTERGAAIGHIHADGQLESHTDAMERLMSRFGLADPDLFRTPSERLADALRRQERRIAYVNEDYRGDRAEESWRRQLRGDS
ncbi:DUF488 domain-containing protein [Nocardia camponoti]|uniref:DUF488 domain-containing protein n=1 Tax=Nocardia camponoti TaxID=1616106 RepID=A0A917QD53_9NOCA|nr:DUF488 domain-containing protein [Nocardia camponoti]GGK44933.1 hypothetical protein GCM10011591_15660 [Nocardia camponoti]